MSREVKMLRRLYEASQRDRTPHRFVNDIKAGFESRQIDARNLSIRQLFEEFVAGGRELAESWKGQNGFGGYQVNLLESAGAVNLTAFQFLTGNMIYQAFKDKWDSPEFIGDQLMDTMKTNLAEEDIPGVGNIGNQSEEIGPGEEFPVAAMNEEVIHMPRVKKTGVRIELTQEIVAYDRSGLVLRQAASVAEGLRLSKEQRQLDVVCGLVNNYIRNDVASNTYQTSGSYVNFKTSNPLTDWTSINKAEQLFNEMVDPNTGDIVMTNANAILVPMALHAQALMILNSTQVSTYTGTNSAISAAVRTDAPNFMKRYDVLTSPLVKQRTTSDTTWFMGNFKRAFLYREVRPLSVDPMPIGDEAWKRDLVAGWRASEWGVAGVYEPRHAEKNAA
ncbi:hypothetical protein SH668x_001261 [Planctomicrobium sp. SH668]|uniref:phage major capsid protein n=1 Tax=Planctomicrobium sp. SH668 TaxID=3448126 RepID=UPI003F5C2611